MKRYGNKPLTERQTDHDDTVSVILPESGTITPGVSNTRKTIRQAAPAAGGGRRYAFNANSIIAPAVNNLIAIRMRKAAAVVAAVEEEAAIEAGWGPWDDGVIIPSMSWLDERYQIMKIAINGAALLVGYDAGDDDYMTAVFPAGDLTTPTPTEIALPGGWSDFWPITANWNGTDDPITIAMTNKGDFFSVSALHLPGTGFHAYYSGNASTGYDNSENNPHLAIDSAGNRHALMSPIERFSPNDFTVQYSKNEATIVKIFGSGSDTYAGGIAVDKADDNNLVLMFSNASDIDGDSEWYTARSSNNGSSWSTPAKLAPFKDNNTFLDDKYQFHVLLGGNGVFLASAPLSPYNDLLYVYSTDGGATWSSEVSHSMPTPNWGGGWQGSVSPDGNYFALWEADRSGGKVRCMLLQWTGSAFDVIVDKFEVFGNVDFADPSVSSWRAIHMQPTDAGGIHVALWISRTGDFKNVIYRRVYTP